MAKKKKSTTSGNDAQVATDPKSQAENSDIQFLCKALQNLDPKQKFFAETTSRLVDSFLPNDASVQAENKIISALKNQNFSKAKRNQITLKIQERLAQKFSEISKAHRFKAEKLRGPMQSRSSAVDKKTDRKSKKKRHRREAINKQTRGNNAKDNRSAEENDCHMTSETPHSPASLTFSSDRYELEESLIRKMKKLAREVDLEDKHAFFVYLAAKCILVGETSSEPTHSMLSEALVPKLFRELSLDLLNLPAQVIYQSLRQVWQRLSHDIAQAQMNNEWS